MSYSTKNVYSGPSGPRPINDQRALLLRLHYFREYVNTCVRLNKMSGEEATQIRTELQEFDTRGYAEVYRAKKDLGNYIVRFAQRGFTTQDPIKVQAISLLKIHYLRVCAQLSTPMSGKEVAAAIKKMNEIPTLGYASVVRAQKEAIDYITRVCQHGCNAIPTEQILRDSDEIVKSLDCAAGYRTPPSTSVGDKEL